MALEDNPFLRLKVNGNLKTVNIMVKLKFYGTEQSGSGDHSLECYVNGYNEIYISIDMEDSGLPSSYISLNTSTAIKLAKVLRQSISEMKEVDRG